MIPKPYFLIQRISQNTKTITKPIIPKKNRKASKSSSPFSKLV